ncbi:MAG: UvrD-helicase domain-containing protein, partial [Bacilli bacterium]|nr:UvrD-helicase domain-containing protein [Bacilli bacterium]
AVLHYTINNLTSNHILIFSPNKIFPEYISNVLPELGEDNTLQCTFDSFLEENITEFRHVEEFSKFIERYYKKQNINDEWIAYKQSNQVMIDLDQYVKELEKNARFIDDLTFERKFFTKDELNHLLNRYHHFRLFEKISAVAHKICDYNYDGKYGKVRNITSKLYKILSVPHDYQKIYKDFYRTKIFQDSYKGKITEKEIDGLLKNKKQLAYEDACLFAYLKGKLEGFEYRGLIKQVVIDEAQDYNKLQYCIIKNIFPKSSFTILGDVNQTINPYYKYESLSELSDIFGQDTQYLELKKTYRSSEEIIEFTNKILNLDHIQAIRKKNNHPVLLRREENIIEQLKNEIHRLRRTSKSIAIITKTDEEATTLFEKLIEVLPEISLLDSKTEHFNRNLVLVSSYIAKGLEFDSVILYTFLENQYTEKEKYLYYVACTRAQHQLVVYNQI